MPVGELLPLRWKRYVTWWIRKGLCVLSLQVSRLQKLADLKAQAGRTGKGWYEKAAESEECKMDKWSYGSCVQV